MSTLLYVLGAVLLVLALIATSWTLLSDRLKVGPRFRRWKNTRGGPPTIY